MTTATDRPSAQHASYRLVEAITTRSSSREWDRARAEWTLESIYFTHPDDPAACLCGHAPIREVCVLRNRTTAERVKVGNVCVTRFIGIPVDKLFRSFAKVAADPAHPLSEAAVEYAAARGWLNDWEAGFLKRTRGLPRNVLSARQLAKRAEVNRVVVARLAGGTT